MRLVITKGGRPRTIKVPLELANEVRNWIDTKRRTYAYRYSKHCENETRRLFLSDHPGGHGRPISAQTIYRCFSEVTPRPRAWSPHKGRHAFACLWTMHALSLDARARSGLAAMPADWVINARFLAVIPAAPVWAHVIRDHRKVPALAHSCMWDRRDGRRLASISGRLMTSKHTIDRESRSKRKLLHPVRIRTKLTCPSLQ